MNIKSIRAFNRLLPVKRPYTIARNTISEVEIVFVQVELTNGIVGLGASSTDEAVVGETAAQTLANLESDKIQGITGRDIRGFLGLIQEVRDAFPAFPGTCAAIDAALHDAFGQWLGIPIVDFYGRAHQAMPTSVTIGIRTVAETLAEAAEYYASGFRVLKVKTGLDPATDAERIIKLFERYGDHFTIRVDANTGYTLEQLQHFQQAATGYHVELVEQPLLPSLDEALLSLPEQSRRLLAADESLKDPASALTLAQSGKYGIFNIKLMKCGGIRGAMEIAGIARPAGISLFWGCNDESVVSIAAALHVAFSLAHTRYIDLDGSFDLAADIASGGFLLENGYMRPASGPGLGVKLL